jgi:hypothetical protein
MSTERTGIMLYCYKKDEGILTLGNKIPSNIYREKPDNEWEDVGTFKIDHYGIVCLSPQDPEWMDDLSGGWRNSHFLINIYNKDMQPEILPRVNGIVLKCFESDETCFLLSNKVPMKGLNRVKTKTRRPSIDWEDVGTFHIELNKLIYHGNIEEDNIDLNSPLYDANFRKINISSY